jgi:hypothetical protein
MNVLALTAMSVFIPPLSGIKSGSLFEPAVRASNSVVFATIRGETISALVLLSNTKVTTCGYATLVGLTHVTISPSLISL